MNQSDDELSLMLGLDRNDPLQRLACALVDSDSGLMADLVEARQKAGLARWQVAERMCTQVSLIEALERADADPRLSTLRRYALAIGALVKHEVTTLPEATSEASMEGSS